MSEYTHPTESELREQFISDFSAELEVDPASIPAKSFEQAMANAEAGALMSTLDYVQYVLDNGLPDSAKAEYRLRWAAIYNVPFLDATAASGSATATGGAPATSLPQGAELQRSDGAVYTTTSAAAVDDFGRITVDVLASEAGADGNCLSGVSLTLSEGYEGLPSSFTVTSAEITGGYEAETADAHTERILFRIQNPPSCGTKADYKRWARAASPGVGSAYVYPLHYGKFSVGVFIAGKDATDPVPDADLVATVQAYIDEQASGLALVTVQPVTEKAVDVALSVTPDTAVVRAAVEQEMAAWMYRAGKTDDDEATYLYRHDLSAAIAAARGVITFTLTLPVTHIVVGPSEYPVLGTVTWE